MGKGKEVYKLLNKPLNISVFSKFSMRFTCFDNMLTMETTDVKMLTKK
jgi:hypothetical protein